MPKTQADLSVIKAFRLGARVWWTAVEAPAVAAAKSANPRSSGRLARRTKNGGRQEVGKLTSSNLILPPRTTRFSSWDSIIDFFVLLVFLPGIAQKKTHESINNRLALVMKSGKYTLGYKTVLKSLRNSKGAFSLRCPSSDVSAAQSFDLYSNSLSCPFYVQIGRDPIMLDFALKCIHFT